MNAEDIASAIASNDPSLGLRAALALHRLAERVEADHVATARQQGWSWQQIGDALGVTRQSVHANTESDSHDQALETSRRVSPLEDVH